MVFCWLLERERERDRERQREWEGERERERFPYSPGHKITCHSHCISTAPWEHLKWSKKNPSQLFSAGDFIQSIWFIIFINQFRFSWNCWLLWPNKRIKEGYGKCSTGFHIFPLAKTSIQQQRSCNKRYNQNTKVVIFKSYVQLDTFNYDIIPVITRWFRFIVTYW